MDGIFAALEQTTLSVWMREDPYAYFIALILHSWGMALLVGGGIVVSLRVLGVGKAAALQKFRGFAPVVRLGIVLAVVSGLLLLIAYPAKALTNPVFAIKFTCLIGAALLTRRMLKDETQPRPLTGGIALALWLGGVAAGKLLLHTYTVLTVT